MSKRTDGRERIDGHYFFADRDGNTEKKIDNAEAFLEELIHYIFVVCKNDDYITPEGICRKLYKYGFIDKKDEEWVTDTPQTTLCRECDDYAGDGMYCASNYLVHDFSTSRENCEADTPQINCDTCKHYRLACELFSEICKYEPKTNTAQTDYHITEDRSTQILDAWQVK